MYDLVINIKAPIRPERTEQMRTTLKNLNTASKVIQATEQLLHLNRGVKLGFNILRVNCASKVSTEPL